MWTVCQSRLKIFILAFSLLTAAATMAAATSGGSGGGGLPQTANADWWQHAVFYQIYPRSFMDSDGDGIGDLRGICEKLSYLAETGIRAVWLSPIFASPMVDFGYDIADFKDIHREYGTMADFEALIAEARRLGIQVVLDFVPNHTSDQCDWFRKSAERVPEFEDFYIWADGREDQTGKRVPPNNWQSVFYGSAWEWHEGRGQFYLHQFTVQQPDLNFRNPRVVAAMDEVLHFWLDRGVSGFRVDAVNHLFEAAALPDEPLSGKTNDSNAYDYTRHIYTKDLPEVFEMLHHWRALLDDYSRRHPDLPQRIMMTEAYADLKTLMDYYEDSEGLRGAHFPFNFHFITDLGPTSDARDFVFQIQRWLVYMPRGHAANWVMGNHDNPRAASRFGAASVDAMNILLMTLPGVAVTYNGEEIGMEDHREISWADTVDPPARNVGPQRFREVSRDPERTPFQWSDAKNAGFSTAARTWLPVHPNHGRLNLAEQQTAPRSHYKVYKALLELRKLPVLREGRLQLEVLSRAVFALRRDLKGEPSLVAVINVSAAPQDVNLSAFLGDDIRALTVLVSSVQSQYSTGHSSAATVPLGLQGHEGLVLLLK